jgi:hypothetical protein
MNPLALPIKPSLFIQKNMPLFLNRFTIFYTLDESQIQYCIHEIKSDKDVSCSIEINMDCEKKRINVLMFYPGLEQLPDTRYFSSVCFFLIIHHFTLFFHLTSNYSIFLRTKETVYNDFYSHLLDFKFLIERTLNDAMVDANCHFFPIDVDVSMITERIDSADYNGHEA